MDSTKRCSRCGTEFPWLQRHHIMPRSQGGPDTPENLDGPYCVNCHEDVHGGLMGGNASQSSESQARRRATMERLAHDPSHRAKISAGNRRAWAEGRRDPVETGRKAHEWHTAHPDENAARIAKIRATKRARFNSDERDRQRLENPRRRLGNGWSLGNPQCARCGTNERKHVGHGLCVTCYKHDEYLRRKAEGKIR